MSRMGTWLAAPWCADTKIAWNLPAIVVFVFAVVGAAIIGASPLRSNLLAPDTRESVTPADLPGVVGETPSADDTPGWRARETAVHIAEQRGRFAWITASLILLVVCVVTIIVSAYTLYASLAPTRRVWTFLAGFGIVGTFAVLEGMSATTLGGSSWTLAEIPAVLSALGLTPGDFAAEYGPEGDLGRLHHGYAWLRQLALVFLLMAITSQLVFAESLGLEPIQGGFERLRALLVCGGALLAVKVAATAVLLAWPLNILKAAHLPAVDDPLHAGQRFDLLAQLRAVAADDTTFEGARWSLMLAVAWIAVHVTLTLRARFVLESKDAAASPSELKQAMKDAGVKGDWRSVVMRTLVILAPYLSAEVATQVKALLGS